MTVLENSQTRMRWRGVWHGLEAIRTFEYVEAEGGEGKTHFTQSEECEGFMGLVLRVDGWMGGNLRKKFVKFNEDLRGYCERTQ